MPNRRERAQATQSSAILGHMVWGCIRQLLVGAIGAASQQASSNIPPLSLLQSLCPGSSLEFNPTDWIFWIKCVF